MSGRASRFCCWMSSMSASAARLQWVWHGLASCNFTHVHRNHFPCRSNPGLELGVMLVRGEQQSPTVLSWLDRKRISRVQVEPLSYTNHFDARCAGYWLSTGIMAGVQLAGGGGLPA